MFHPLLFLKKLPQSPVFNLAAIALTLATAAPIFSGAIVDVSLSTRATLDWIERLAIVYFAIESLLRALRFRSPGDYLRSSTAWIDLLSIAPAAILLFYASQNQDIPGAIILRGGRMLRLIPLYQFFRQERSLGLRPAGSRLEFRLAGASALLLYVFLLSGGMAMSIIHDRLSQEERDSRVLRVRRSLDLQGLRGIELLAPGNILKIEKRSPGESFEHYYQSRDYIQSHLRPDRDFVYVEGSNPEEGVLLNLRDLRSRQEQFEVSLLATGLLMISALTVLFHIYFRQRILDPVERARRVLDLRIQGEEIEHTDTPGGVDNEITELIEHIDEFYRTVRAPASSGPQG